MNLEASRSQHETDGVDGPRMTWRELRELCLAALRKAGADEVTAKTLTEATLDAERRGREGIGVPHLFDYLAALQGGRLNGSPQVHISSAFPVVLTVDADRGTAQLGYATAREEFHSRVQKYGLAMLGIGNSFTSGEIGYYAADMAQAGFIALAGGNSPALMSIFGAKGPVIGTNPISFAIPGSPRPRVIDQASSATAWGNIRQAAQEGKRIPAAWAIDRAGAETSEPRAAMAGSLLPAGGVKGANIAVLVDVLAVFAGGNFSFDAPSFIEGDQSPGMGLWVIGLDSAAAAQTDFIARVDRHFARLHEHIGHDFGRRRAELLHPEVDAEHIARLRKFLSLGGAP